MHETPTAVILGLWVNGLGIIRSLAKEGIKTVGFYQDNREIGRFSRYCIPIRSPDINEEEKLLQFLIDFGNKIKRRIVLFAESDDYILFISRNREILGRYFLFALPERNLLEKIVNKKEFYRTCEVLGIPYPKTYYFSTMEELSRISSNIGYPCIIKPALTRLFEDRFNKKVLLAESQRELLKICKSVNDMFEQIMIQEVISGKDDTIYFCGAYFGLDAKPKGVSLGRKIRQYPPGFGVTSLAESISDGFLLDLSISTLKKMKFKGLCDIEFKKDPRDNKFKIIEINARTGLWHTLCTASGVNLCAIAFYDLTNYDPTKKRHIQVIYNQRRIRWINEELDIGASYRYFKRGDLSLNAWITSLKGIRSLAISRISDPAPTFFLFLMLMKHFTKKFFFNLKSTLAVVSKWI